MPPPKPPAASKQPSGARPTQSQSQSHSLVHAAAAASKLPGLNALRGLATKGLPPLLPGDLPNLSPQALAAAASAYRQPAPPPQLPQLQFASRHQTGLAGTDDDSPGVDAEGSTAAASRAGNGEEEERLSASVIESGPQPCPHGRKWPAFGSHTETRLEGIDDSDLEDFISDMAIVVRQEYDCWVEACWAEAFHYLFTRAVPTLLIHLILRNASPTYLRRQVVYGGHDVDRAFQLGMLKSMYDELENRLSGVRPQSESRAEPSFSSPLISDKLASAMGLGGLGGQPESSGVPRDGVCTYDLASTHYAGDGDGAANVDGEAAGKAAGNTRHDHSACLCQLTSCLACFHTSARNRKGPVGALPYDLCNSKVADQWMGHLESKEQYTARRARFEARIPHRATPPVPIPEGRGFVQHPKQTSNGTTNSPADAKYEPPRRPPLFPHPQMTDILAVEEHIRWRLKELGADDPSVHARYGPCNNSPAALEGLEDALPVDNDDDDAGKGGAGGTKMAVGRVKGRSNKTAMAPIRKDSPKPPEPKCYLPREWTDADPAARNMAIILTYRHFVKLLYEATMCASPFAYNGYERDVDDLNKVHPVAMYRRLAEPSITRLRKNTRELRTWQECMDGWTEQLGLKEKEQGNKMIHDAQHDKAVHFYSRAISLDGKERIYYTNRALALNALKQHPLAELDCRHILTKERNNVRALYQLTVALVGQGKWREAEPELNRLIKLQPELQSAKALLTSVKKEVAKLPKQTVQDALNF